MDIYLLYFSIFEQFLQIIDAYFKLFSYMVLGWAFKISFLCAIVFFSFFI